MIGWLEPTDWPGVVNHLYLTSQGIYGLPVGVVATYVFHFVLFGVLATRMGLGKLFIDLEDRTIELKPQQGVTISKGVMHRPRAPIKTVMLMVETSEIMPVGD